MNRESISHYLKNPSKLVDISVNQIEKWLRESPYSQPLRVLLAKKLHYRKEVLLDSAVIGASTLSGNRQWLYKELHDTYESKSESDTDDFQKEEIAIPASTIAATALSNVDSVTAADEIELIKEDSLTEVIEENTNEDISEADLAEESIEQESLEKEEVELNFEVEYEEILIAEKSEEEEEEEEEETDIQDSNVQTHNESAEDEYNDEPNVPIFEPSVATLKDSHDALKVVDIDPKNTDLEIEYVESDEEFIVSKDKKDKKKKKNKKKSKSKPKPKKKSTKKDKKKKGKKEDSDKTKKGKKSDKKKTNKKDKSNKSKKSTKAQRKALSDYWDNKVGTISPPPGAEKKEKKKSKSKKKRKIKLTKVDVPVNTNGENANQYEESLDEMSNYTQWLLTFGKDKGLSSTKHMKALKKKKRKNKIEEISFSKSTVKAKKSKKAKKKKKSKARNTSKTDKSLKAKEEIISELWADLLAKQGHIKKARKMYLKLSLKYPEKSTYFAAKLENL